MFCPFLSDLTGFWSSGQLEFKLWLEYLTSSQVTFIAIRIRWAYAFNIQTDVNRAYCALWDNECWWRIRNQSKTQVWPRDMLMNLSVGGVQNQHCCLFSSWTFVLHFYHFLGANNKKRSSKCSFSFLGLSKSSYWITERWKYQGHHVVAALAVDGEAHGTKRICKWFHEPRHGEMITDAFVELFKK